jgi:hypothetical protein
LNKIWLVSGYFKILGGYFGYFLKQIWLFFHILIWQPWLRTWDFHLATSKPSSIISYSMTKKKKLAPSLKNEKKDN